MRPDDAAPATGGSGCSTTRSRSATSARASPATSARPASWPSRRRSSSSGSPQRLGRRAAVGSVPLHPAQPGLLDAGRVRCTADPPRSEPSGASDRSQIDVDRQVATRTQSDTEFLAREIANVRIMLSDAVTGTELREQLGEVTASLDAINARLDAASQRGRDDGDLHQHRAGQAEGGHRHQRGGGAGVPRGSGRGPPSPDPAVARRRRRSCTTRCRPHPCRPRPGWRPRSPTPRRPARRPRPGSGAVRPHRDDARCVQQHRGCRGQHRVGVRGGGRGDAGRVDALVHCARRPPRP